MKKKKNFSLKKEKKIVVNELQLLGVKKSTISVLKNCKINERSSHNFVRGSGGRKEQRGGEGEGESEL